MKKKPTVPVINVIAIFEIPETVALKKEHLLCQDCMRGFEVWRGKITDSQGNNQKHVLTKAGSKTTFRKKCT